MSPELSFFLPCLIGVQVLSFMPGQMFWFVFQALGRHFPGKHWPFSPCWCIYFSPQMEFCQIILCFLVLCKTVKANWLFADLFNVFLSVGWLTLYVRICPPSLPLRLSLTHFPYGYKSLKQSGICWIVC